MDTAPAEVTSRRWLEAREIVKGDKVQITMPVEVTVWSVEEAENDEGEKFVIVDWYLPRPKLDTAKMILRHDGGAWVTRDHDDDDEAGTL